MNGLQQDRVPASLFPFIKCLINLHTHTPTCCWENQLVPESSCWTWPSCSAGASEQRHQTGVVWGPADSFGSFLSTESTAIPSSLPALLVVSPPNSNGSEKCFLLDRWLIATKRSSANEKQTFRVTCQQCSPAAHFCSTLEGNDSSINNPPAGCRTRCWYLSKCTNDRIYLEKILSRFSFNSWNL